MIGLNLAFTDVEKFVDTQFGKLKSSKLKSKFSNSRQQSRILTENLLQQPDVSGDVTDERSQGRQEPRETQPGDVLGLMVETMCQCLQTTLRTASTRPGLESSTPILTRRMRRWIIRSRKDHGDWGELE